MSSVFLDTSSLIYYLDGFEPFATKVEQFLLSTLNSSTSLYTSTITDTEYFVYPYRENNFSKIIIYKSFLQDVHIQKVCIDDSIAEKAAQIRAFYQSIKTPDSLQLASAIKSGCDVFLANDKQLKQVQEIRVLLVDEL